MKQKQKASSLILVLLVVAGIITVIFGTQRIVLVQYNQANSEEDNLYAYYAAKAGIEDGLLRYRISKNVEISDKNKPFQYNLATGGYKADNSLKSRASESNYDLNIEYKTSEIKGKSLERNSTITLSGFSNTQQVNSFIYLNFNRGECSIDGASNLEDAKAKAFVQIQVIKSSGELVNTVASFGSNSSWNTVDSGNGNIIINSADKVLQLRFTPYFCDVTFDAYAAEGNNTKDVANSLFDSLNTTITATGKFGNAKRTLVALIDRTSDKLIGIYEYNAYSGLGNIIGN